MNRKAVSLLSGGLDSILATRLVMDQGIEVEALHFTSVFCTCTKGDRGCGMQAPRTARELGIKLTVRMKGLDYLEILKKPRHGYGRGMNPCIDCRIYTLRKAKEFMDEIGASFVVTGEVLGQRPMSQRRHAIERIEKESGLSGLIVRPLSAKHFPPTEPEKEGILDRGKLLDIEGRSRKRQYELVDEFHLTEFGCPAGGCLLTDPVFAVRVKDLFARAADIAMKDLTLLRVGRHFRLSPEVKLILGRNREENDRLLSLWSPPEVILKPCGFKGPIGLAGPGLDTETLGTAAGLMAFYGKVSGPEVTIDSDNGTPLRHTLPVEPVDTDKLVI
jgi:tRNA U34 2-thiouridine synthase MnmA/TrmU